MRIPVFVLNCDNKSAQVQVMACCGISAKPIEHMLEFSSMTARARVCVSGVCQMCVRCVSGVCVRCVSGVCQVYVSGVCQVYVSDVCQVCVRLGSVSIQPYGFGNLKTLVIRRITPLCKSNGTFFSYIDINELTSVLHKYKTPVTKCCIFTCCWVNLVCIRHLIVKIMPEKHVWGPDFLMSDSPYIFQLFEN